MVVVDNHLINNPVFSVVHADGKTRLASEVWDQIFKIRAIVLDTMARLSQPHLSFVITNFLMDEEEDKAECRKIEAIAEQAAFVECEVEENRRRIVSPERGPNLKPIDPSLPDRMHKGPSLLRCDGFPNRIEMDVTHVRPADAARRILQEIDRDRTPRRRQRPLPRNPK